MNSDIQKYFDELSTSSRKPDISFCNGKSDCGCIMVYSSGGGEYSEAHFIYLCEKHKGKKA